MKKHELIGLDGEWIAGYAAVKHSSMNNINIHTHKAVRFLYASNKAIKHQCVSASTLTALQSRRDRETCDDLITWKSDSGSVQLGFYFYSLGHHFCWMAKTVKVRHTSIILIKLVVNKRTWEQKLAERETQAAKKQVETIPESWARPLKWTGSLLQLSPTAVIVAVHCGIIAMLFQLFLHIHYSGIQHQIIRFSMVKTCLIM